MSLFCHKRMRYKKKVNYGPLFMETRKMKDNDNDKSLLLKKRASCGA